MNPQKKLLAECAKRTPINTRFDDIVGGLCLALFFLFVAFL
jgi:hypothetical protein